jgi:tetratricopeptide (TPR) repeat protein
MGLFDNLFKKKGFPEKINVLGKEIEIIPDAMVYSQFGLDKYEQKDYLGAVNEFTKAINAQPNNQNFYTMRGTAYEDLKNDLNAEKDFRKTLELNETDFVAAYRLGMIYFRRKDIENAVKWLRISHKNAPDVDLSSVGVTNNNIIFVHKKIIAGNLGNFLTQVRNFEEGFKYLDEAIELDPKYHNPYMAKGMAYAQMGKPEKGIPYLKKALELGNKEAEMAIKMLEQLTEPKSENKEISDFIRLCKKATDLYLLNPSESDYDLGEILTKTIRKSILLKDIPEKDFGLVGKAFLCLLDRVNDEDFFQTLSTLSYYFLSKDIDYSNNPKTYVDRILVLNLGARTFCKTVAKATNQDIPTYINFNNMSNLPIPVKDILLMELYDFSVLPRQLMINDYMNRKNALENLARENIFSSICSNKEILSKGHELHKIVFAYIEREVIVNGVVFFR